MSRLSCSMAPEVLQIIAPVIFFMVLVWVMIQSLNGAGDTKTPTWINFFGFWLFQIPFAYLWRKDGNGCTWCGHCHSGCRNTNGLLPHFIILKKGKWKEVKL
jgi:Na+-driven multidrug efflux pump